MKQQVHAKLRSKIDVAYKKADVNFSNELGKFLSQSKHAKQQQIQQINEYMIEQFLHLFEICNISRYLQYTKQFIQQLRSTILRLEIVQKNPYGLLDQKDEYMYLIIEGKVQKISRQKPQLGKRSTNLMMNKFNNTFSSFTINSNPSNNNGNLLSVTHHGAFSLSARNSHHSINNNQQLRQLQRTILMNRQQRMSILSGNLYNQLISSPRHSNRKSRVNSNSFQDKRCPQSPLLLKPKSSRFGPQQQEQNLIKQQEHSGQCSSFQQQQKCQQYKVQLLEPLQTQVYRCSTKVKYIKLLKWSYDQLIQYVYKYQNDRLIYFLSNHLLISQGDVKLHQIYNKSNYIYCLQRQSRHSNQFIQLNKQSIYILRKGSVEMKYHSATQSKATNTNPNTKDINLADYLMKTQKQYKTVILNEGAVICPFFEPHTFFIQALENIVFVQINKKLIQYLKHQIKLSTNQWLDDVFRKDYQKHLDHRKTFMKDEAQIIKQQKMVIKMENVAVDTKNRRRRQQVNSCNQRFRSQKLNQKQQRQRPSISIDIRRSVNQGNSIQQEFSTPQYKQFISLLPYSIMVQSKSAISLKLNEKSKSRHITSKISHYFKKNTVKNRQPKVTTSTKYKNNKVLELKMKNIASKQMNAKDLQLIYQDMNKQQFNNSLKGNWFKQQMQTIGSNTFSKLINQVNKDPKDRRQSSKSGMTQILVLNKKFNESKKKFDNPNVIDRDDLRKNVLELNAQQQEGESSDEEYLSNDDTGLIKKFAQNSHNYQKQISYLISSSKRDQKGKRKLKTQGNHLFSHNLINDIMKRLNHGNFKTTKLSSSDQLQSLEPAPPVQNASEVFPLNILQTLQNTQTFQDLPKQDQKQNMQRVAFVSKYNKEKPATSFTNHSSKSSRSKFLQSSSSNNMDQISFNRVRSIESANPKKSFDYYNKCLSLQKAKRPATASTANMSKFQCKSLMFNQWIQTQPSNNHDKTNYQDEWSSVHYNYNKKDIAQGDVKIWKKLDNGKIVKKSVKRFINQSTQQKPKPKAFIRA